MNRPIVVVPLTLAVSLLVIIGQTGVKYAINAAPKSAAGLAFLGAILRSPSFYWGVAVGAIGTFTWMYVLAKADFSYAVPLLTFCGILVAMVSAKVILHEPLGARRTIGTLLIAAGALLVSRS